MSNWMDLWKNKVFMDSCCFCRSKDGANLGLEKLLCVLSGSLPVQMALLFAIPRPEQKVHSVLRAQLPIEYPFSILCQVAMK